MIYCQLSSYGYYLEIAMLIYFNVGEKQLSK